MGPLRHTLTIATKKPIEVIDLTDLVREFVAKSGCDSGLLHVMSPHTTMGLSVNERCERLQEDMIDFLGRIAPAQADYRHNRIAVDGRPNAHSHLLSLFLPGQLTLMVDGGQLKLGDWQSLFAIELDGPRPLRKIELNLIGF